MGKRSYPPLTPGEIETILKNLGFALKRQEGSHEQWFRPADGKRIAALVTLDRAYREIGDIKLLRNMIRQSTFSRDQFYGASKGTARKAGVPYWVGRSVENETNES